MKFTLAFTNAVVTSPGLPVKVAVGAEIEAEPVLLMIIRNVLVPVTNPEFTIPERVFVNVNGASAPEEKDMTPRPLVPKLVAFCQWLSHLTGARPYHYRKASQNLM